MRVGLVTIISRNYGNRLQNYALQQVLLRLNLDVETFSVKRRKKCEKVRFLLKNIVAKCVKEYKPSVWENFDSKIIWSKYITSDSKVKLNKRYDYFIAGSDQIWNPLFQFNTDREFLTFANNEKRIAYAASIGLDDIPVEYVSTFTKNVEGMNRISVREKEAEEIIRKYTNKDALVVLDPTMLIAVKDWQMLLEKSCIKTDKQYVLRYFLGQVSEEQEECINNYSQEKNIEILDVFNNSYGDKIGPIEFLYLIYNSEAMFTDSFHGTVFSILFHKEFYIFERPYEEGYGKMNSRISTLLATFDLENRICSADVLKKGNMSEINFSLCDEILDAKRDEAYKYLIEALNLEKYK